MAVMLSLVATISHRSVFSSALCNHEERDSVWSLFVPRTKNLAHRRHFINDQNKTDEKKKKKRMGIEKQERNHCGKFGFRDIGVCSFIHSFIPSESISQDCKSGIKQYKT